MVHDQKREPDNNKYQVDKSNEKSYDREHRKHNS